MIPFICLVKDNDISTPSPSPTVPSPNTCPNSSPCPSGWTYIETFKSCYKLIYTVNGASGDENCRVANANLASIHSPEQNQIVYELTKTGVNDLQAWILFGGQRTGPGVDDWKWSDGSPWNYTNWAPGEPNSGDSHCVRIYADVTNPAITAKWDDWSCDRAYRAALCQQPAKF
ncbi:unnamed protein product, partial [Mesorhabditis belari]|uniref:C-type lectin domain-containing protein n=1 Tax=Mesorhabditis belari TaxID=2138241 RepID=A0AAF3F9D1_9BILA